MPTNSGKISAAHYGRDVGYIFCSRFIAAGKATHYGVAVFVAGIFLNELLLMIQGVGAISDVMVPNRNVALLFVACIMFTGVLVLNLSLKKRPDVPPSDGFAESRDTGRVALVMNV